MPLKFALHPGWIWINGTRTFKSSAELAEKYGLPSGSWFSWLAVDQTSDWHEYIHLYPRQQGDYATALDAALREDAARKQS